MFDNLTFEQLHCVIQRIVNARPKAKRYVTITRKEKFIVAGKLAYMNGVKYGSGWTIFRRNEPATWKWHIYTLIGYVRRTQYRND